MNKLPVWVYVIAGLLLLRLAALDHLSFWRDEMYSVYLTSPNISFHDLIFLWLRDDVHPPLFHIILFGWQRLGFNSDYWVTFLPFSASAIILCMAVWRMRAFLPEPALGFYALLLFGAPVAAWAMLEVRSYPINYALAALSWPYFLQAREDLKVGRLSSSFYACAFIACIGSLFHFFFIAFSGAQLLLLLYLLSGEKQYKKALKSSAIYLVAYLPVSAWMLFQHAALLNKSGGRFWIKNKPDETLYSLITNYFGDIPLPAYSQLCLLLAGIFMISLPWRKLYTNLSLYLWHMLVFLIGIIIVCFNTPVVTSRNLIVLMPSVAICIALVYQTLLDHTFYRRALKVFLCGTILAGVYQVFFAKNEEWREASEYITQHYSSPDCKIPVRPWIESSPRSRVDIFYKFYLPAELDDRIVYYAQHQKNCNLLMVAYGDMDLRSDEEWMDTLGVNYRVIYLRGIRIYEITD